MAKLSSRPRWTSRSNWSFPAFPDSTANCRRHPRSDKVLRRAEDKLLAEKTPLLCCKGKKCVCVCVWETELKGQTHSREEETGETSEGGKGEREAEEGTVETQREGREEGRKGGTGDYQRSLKPSGSPGGLAAFSWAAFRRGMNITLLGREASLILLRLLGMSDETGRMSAGQKSVHLRHLNYTSSLIIKKKEKRKKDVCNLELLQLPFACPEV